MKKQKKQFRQRRKSRFEVAASRNLELLEERIALTGSPLSLDINAAGASNPSDFVQIGNETYFVAEDNTNGRELWRTDGTAAGTTLVSDIVPGVGSSEPIELVALNGSLLFVADDGSSGEELWISDGTSAGTQLLSDILSGANGSAPRELVELNGRVYFSAESDGGAELWSTDGTSAGTQLVADLSPGETNSVPNSSDPLNLTVSGSQLYFTANDGSSGRELWTSNGTAAGTVLVRDINTVSGGDSNPSQLTDLNGELFFVADTVENGTELWKSDGTSTGTVLVQDILPGSGNGLSAANEMIAANNRLFFAAADSVNGPEIWSTDGTATGTQIVRDIQPGIGGGITQTEFATAGNVVFFVADDGTNGRELWQTDGTSSNTVLVSDINSASGGSSSPAELTVVGNSLFFSADDGVSGRELWESDGTAAGTQLIADINTGSADSEPVELFAFNDVVLFGANGGEGFDLWAVDSTTTPLPAPTAIDLLSSSDTGFSDDDNLTSRNNADSGATLAFQITGAQSGALVELFADDLLIGSATAATSSVTITTSGSEVIADGSSTLRAIQTLNGLQSQSSPTSQLTIDTTAPGAIVSTPPASAQLGEIYAFNADSPDEGVVGTFYSLTSEPGGMVINSVTGQLTWTPTSSQTAPQTFDIVVGDAAGNTTSREVTVNVLADIPALADTYTLDEDDTLTVNAETGVLANDDDSRSLTASVVDQPTNGTVVLNSDGSFVYTPNADFNGTDTFTYQATDGSDDSNVAMVTLTVTPVNDAPTVVDNDYLVTEDITLNVDTALSVLVNDIDVDGDTLTATLATPAANGTVVLNPDGSFTYTPNANFTGDDTFTYTASDGTITSAPATVTLRVAPIDDLPTVAADNYTVTEDTQLTVAVANGVLANDVDPDGGDLTATVVNEPTNGTLVLSGDGSFTYTPDDNFSGTDTFTYTASDGTTVSTEGTVTLTVEAVDDLPVAENDTFTAGNDGTSRLLDVLANDSDADIGDALTITDVTAGSSGGTIAIENGQLRYTATTGFMGVETFDYTVQDTGGQSTTATVTVNVGDATVANTVSGVVYVDHDGDNSRGNEAGVPGVQITLTGQDTNGASVTQTTLTDNNGFYEFTDVAAGTYSLTQRQPQALTDGSSSTPNGGATADGNVISNLSVTGGQATTGNNFSESGLRAAYHSIVWQFAKRTSPQTTGGIFREMVAIAEEDAGDEDFANEIRQGQIGDDNGNNDQLTPVANGDTYATDLDTTLTVSASNGVLANDTDPNGDAITATLSTDVTNGTLNLASDGSFTYTPDSGFRGNDTFQYTVSDGTNTSTPATVTIGVGDNAANTAPTAAADTYAITEDQLLTVDSATGVLNNDTDGENDTLTATLRSTTSNGTLNLATDGSFTYQPNADFSGDDTFAYTANDGQEDSAQVVVTITVNSVNDDPVAVDDSFTMNEDGSLAFSAASGVLANDSDAEDAQSQLTVSVVNNPSEGTLTLNSDGSFNYTAAADSNGTFTFTYRITDTDGATAEATATIQIAAVNDAPTAVDDVFSVAEDTTLAIDAAMAVLVNDNDVDGDTITAIVEALPTDGTLSLNTDGTFTYTPDADFAGTDRFTYRVSDGTLTSNLATATITVTEVDDLGSIVLPAEFSNPSQIPTRVVGQPIAISVSVDDVDDSDYRYQLDLEASGIPTAAAQPTIDPSSGEISWTPTATGQFEIRVIVVNGNRLADQETFLVDILASDVDSQA